MACMFKASGIMDEQGGLHLETLQSDINAMDTKEAGIWQNMLDLCMQPQGANECEVAYSLNKCWKLADSKVR